MKPHHQTTIAPPAPPAASREKRKQKRNLLNRLIERDEIQRTEYSEYRDDIRNLYDGPRGAVLSLCSLLSLHTVLGERVFKQRHFDLQGATRILDVGSGAGQLAQHLVKYTDQDASIVCCDLSHRMLCRARSRLKSDRVRFVTSDLTRLPFQDGTFDCITCGYVLEHLPDAKPGLQELSRVLKPGGRMLLITTEDTFYGAWTSRLWNCRTYCRTELRRLCEVLGLTWHKEIWFSPVHRAIRLGGICVEIVKN